MATAKKLSLAARSDQAKIRIEKNVPLPPRKNKISESYATYERMEIGDSFLIPKGKRSSYTTSAVNFKRTTKGWNYTIRNVGNGDFRLWRIAAA